MFSPFEYVIVVTDNGLYYSGPVNFTDNINDAFGFVSESMAKRRISLLKKNGYHSFNFKLEVHNL